MYPVGMVKITGNFSEGAMRGGWAQVVFPCFGNHLVLMATHLECLPWSLDFSSGRECISGTFSGTLKL